MPRQIEDGWEAREEPECPLCMNPRGCDCRSKPSEPHPSCKTPDGCRENGCLGWCDEYRPDPALKPDIAALKRRLAADQDFAALVTGAEFECLGDPSLCTNPRGCACVPDSKTPNARLSGCTQSARTDS